MRIDVKAVNDTMEAHLEEGIDNVCERLCYDDAGVAVMLCRAYGSAGPLMTGAVALGIDLGLKLAQSKNNDPEPTESHDAFLESLPEAAQEST